MKWKWSALSQVRRRPNMGPKHGLHLGEFHAHMSAKSSQRTTACRRGFGGKASASKCSRPMFGREAAERFDKRSWNPNPRSRTREPKALNNVPVPLNLQSE